MENLSHVPQEFLDKVKKILDRKNSLEQMMKEGNTSSGAHGEISTEQMQKELEMITGKLTKLLLEYNLEMSQIEAHSTDKKKKQPVGEAKVSLQGKQTRHEAGWMETLYFVIAKANMCAALFQPGRNGKDDMGQMIIFGTAMNIELVCYFVDQVGEKIRELAGIAWRRYNGMEKRNTFRRGFFRGAVHGLRAQLVKDEEMLPPSSEMGLMVINNRREVMQYMQIHYSFKPGKSSSLSGVGGYAQGVEAGKGLSMNKGLGSGQKKLGY